jgi:nucleoside-diphosphate-sugar epimerase
VVNHAMANNYHVRALSRTPTSVTAAEPFQADILNPAAIREAMRGVDFVIHAAALAHVSPRTASVASFDTVNHIGAVNVAQAAARAAVKRYVLVSSVAVYGQGEHKRDEDEPCRPDSPYGRSKLLAEEGTRQAFSGTGVSFQILRLATVFGEGDPGNMARLIHAIQARRFIWVGDGRNRKSLIYRDDAAGAMLAALRLEHSAGPFNVTAPAVSMNELVATICKASGRRVPSTRLAPGFARKAASVLKTLSPRGRGAAVAESIDKWLRNDEYDGTRFYETTGFSPQTTLLEGIERELGWMRSNSAGSRP